MWPQVVVVSIVWVDPTLQEVCFIVDLCPLWLPPFPDVSPAANISGAQSLAENTPVVAETLPTGVKETKEINKLY